MPKRKNNTPVVEPSVDFSKLTVVLLKKECQQRNLETSGRKVELIKRLQDFESQNDQVTKAEPEEENSDKDLKDMTMKENQNDQVTKEEPEEENSDKDSKDMTMKEKLSKIAAEEKKNKINKQQRYKVDEASGLVHISDVFEDYSCMLNQTNIGANNNKFYVIQLLNDSTNFHLWTRWGRVGDKGESQMKMFDELEPAVKAFEKKFKDKTKNAWKDRENFKPAAGKYTLLEMDEEADSQDIESMEQKLNDHKELDDVDGPTSSKKPKKVGECRLDKTTQSLIKLIFDNDMFKEAMTNFDIDVKKMPLGKLSKIQIAKGFEVLEELEEALKSNNPNKLNDLTSKFFTMIPHNFGRKRPPLINDIEVLQKKMDMLMVLGDIEIAQSLQKAPVKDDGEECLHPLDVQYELLKCGLTLVDKKSKTHKIIETYVKNTKQGCKLLDVWEVDRENEGESFREHKDIGNRKLLWHGTNVAVVVAILKSGLRIMPHSGGRVGRGIYFASEHSKSAAYVQSSRTGTGIMFLNEVALGKQHVIQRDDHTLRAPPKGFDSVLAQGQCEPDPSKDTKIKLDGNDVIVPQGKPEKTDADRSSFYQSEYLVYKENQSRIRYLLTFKMH